MSAINEWFGGYCCMFRYIGRTYGEQELHRYFTYLAQTAYDDVTPGYRAGGLPAIAARYEKNFRTDGGEEAVRTKLTEQKLTMQVRCPAFYNSPEPIDADRRCDEFFCDCCRELNGKILAEAGYDLDIGMEHCGDCCWTITKKETEQ